MIYINKEREPESFENYRNSLNAHFDDMPREIKDELRQALLQEQGCLCAYCMSRIKESKDIKIEHYQARNSNNELEYANLLAVCKGNEGVQSKHQTCDTKKGEQVLHINPLKKSDMETIFYQIDGTIKSSNEVFDADIEKVLNLNNEYGYLKANRKGAINAVALQLKKLKQGESAENLLRRIKTKYMKNGSNNMKEPYIGIILWYVDKKLKKY